MTKSRIFAITAAISWFAVGLGFVLNVFNVYPDAVVEPFAYGNNVNDVFSGTVTSTATGTSYSGSSFTKQITINMESDIPDRLVDYGSISFTTTEQYDFGSIA